MVIADPFGSWVTGAHQGLTDAMALRGAEDETKKNAYALNRSAQFDPYALQEAKAKAGLEGLNLEQSQQFQNEGLPLEQERLKTGLLRQRQAQGYADYGDPFLLMQELQRLGGGALEPSTAGGTPTLRHPYQYQGGQYTYGVPTPNIGSPRQAQLTDIEQYRTAVEARKREEDAAKAAAATAKGTSIYGLGGAPDQDSFLDTSSLNLGF